LVDEISLVGSRERIADRLGAWKDAGKRGEIGAILMRGASMEAVRALAEEVL
jgi:alkanesulfonate monooxygenase SsuD/methylene tetrahydromethanopterin reductase-like flavin-dependent oxidoreductase (luciferase family)